MTQGAANAFGLHVPRDFERDSRGRSHEQAERGTDSAWDGEQPQLLGFVCPQSFRATDADGHTQRRRDRHRVCKGWRVAKTYSNGVSRLLGHVKGGLCNVVQVNRLLAPHHTVCGDQHLGLGTHKRKYQQIQAHHTVCSGEHLGLDALKRKGQHTQTHHSVCSDQHLGKVSSRLKVSDFRLRDMIS